MLCTGGMLVSQMTNKHKLGAWGLVGGGEGKTGATLFKRQAAMIGKQPLKHMVKLVLVNILISRCDQVTGSEFWPPAEVVWTCLGKSKNKHLSDVKEGYVSNADAIRQYSLDESDI